MASTPKSSVRASGEISVSRTGRPPSSPAARPSSVLESFSPPTSSQPCTKTLAGGSMPAAMHMAGHHTQWNRRISLPIRWWTAGHQWAKRCSSSP